MRTNGGFSLLELVASIAIISIGIVTVLQAFSYCTNIAGLSCDLVDAVLLAEDKLQELEFKKQEKLLSQGILSSADTFGKFERRYSLTRFPEQDMEKLDIEISWLRTKRKERLTATTYLR